MRYQHKDKAGATFIIYALICPLTLKVRYVGQTCGELHKRTKTHSPYNFKGLMREWLVSLQLAKPIAFILEQGINRKVTLTVTESKGNGGTRQLDREVWLASIRESIWQKRFHRTLFNDTPIESKEAAALLRNPPLPWDDAA